MTLSQPFHSDIVLQLWLELDGLLEKRSTGSTGIMLGASTLNLAEVVGISRINQGDSIYGVSTGFGASAYLRISTGGALQHILTRELSYGILPPGTRDHPTRQLEKSLALHRDDFSEADARESEHIPWTWVRAAILIRIKSLIKGCSGVRPVIVERLLDLLTHDILPMIPLRGSISASGDLTPLAYISGAIQGKSTTRVLTKDGTSLYADAALRATKLDPVILGQKEGLAIVTGTAISAAAGAMATHQANTLATLAQVLTAMSVEGLAGTTESFNPFFSEVRRHPGQIESSRNILAFLKNTKLAYTNDGFSGALRQDRYSIRTAPQWLGPSLEDLVLANQQLSTECNSATDNPLISPEGDALHGGNFQAKAVTSAMEKVRQAVQSIGRMLYVQCTEMINPSTSRGLLPNLIATDPSTSGIFKGTDIDVSALQAELGFLAGPVNHVQTAELGNQSLNSLALISARYTHITLSVLTELAAAHLLTACQAVDLRALHESFLERFRTQWPAALRDAFCGTATGKMLAEGGGLEEALWQAMLKGIEQTSYMDASARFLPAVKALRTSLLAAEVESAWTTHRNAYLEHGDAQQYLGCGTRELYLFVRKTLGVPLLSTKVIQTPHEEDVRRAPTIGSYTSVVYRALRDGTLIPVLRRILEGVERRGIGTL